MSFGAAVGAPRVGLNLLYLVPSETGGTETYARQLVPALVAARGGAPLTLFSSPELAKELDREPWCDGLDVVALPFPGRTRVRRVLGEQTLLPLAVRRSGVDLVHHLATTAPAVSGARSVVTIHDLIYRTHPDSHPGLLTHGMRLLVPLAARRATRVLTISEAVKGDIVRELGVDPLRVDVVHHGPGLQSADRPTPERELRARLQLGEGQLVLTPSARRPHKNLLALIEAMARVDGGATLVVPGYTSAYERELQERAAALGIAERVRFCGWVSEADLEGLYDASTCLAFPSLAEGFGLPVLEAMRRGLPVACSDRTSLPEVAGGAALLFDPGSVDAIAGAISRLLRDNGLRAELAERGRERASTFSWERAARETLIVYDRALGRAA